MNEAATPVDLFTPTPLAAWLQESRPDLALRMHAGSATPIIFSSPEQEFRSALNKSTVYDLGYRTRILITGEDRLRWLNGMVSNAIQALAVGHGNYNLVLNAQGKIQGDAYIYRSPDHLSLDTDRSQAERILTHLDHFIIMDDVELRPLDGSITALGLVGPQAAAALDALGLEASALPPLQFVDGTLSGAPVGLVRGFSTRLPRYELWLAPEDVGAAWTALLSAGVEPIGIATLEALRIWEGIPSYGADFSERNLPQETGQTRALNFTKGCYLGQEIVERIRSRATIHRSLRQFSLQGELPTLPADLRPVGESSPVGQITSTARIPLAGYSSLVALGFLRSEAVERKLAIEYNGGSATVLEEPPALPAAPS